MDPQLPDDGNVSTIFKTTIKYVDTRMDLFKLLIVKKASDSVSSIISRLVAAVLLTLALILLSIGGSIWLGKCLGATEYGFLAIGAFFLIVGIIFFLFKNPLIKAPVSSILIKKALK